MKRPAYFKGGSLDGQGADLDKKTTTYLHDLAVGREVYRRTNRKVTATSGGASVVARVFVFERNVEKISKKV